MAFFVRIVLVVWPVTKRLMASILLLKVSHIYISNVMLLSNTKNIKSLVFCQKFQIVMWNLSMGSISHNKTVPDNLKINFAAYLIA